MELRKVGKYNGKPASLILLEESLGRTKSLFQYYCNCGDKFFSLIYALQHCEKRHAGEPVQERLKYEMILRRDLMQVLYDAASENIAQERENQIQKRLEAESLKHRQELQQLEERLRDEFEQEKRDNKIQEFLLSRVKAEPMSPTRAEESYSDITDNSPFAAVDFGFSEVLSINYQPTVSPMKSIPTLINGRINPNTFNAATYYDSFEQDNQVPSGVIQYGKRPRESIDSGYGMSPEHLAEKRALIEEEVKDTESGASSFSKIVIPLKMNRPTAKLPKKPLIMRESGCQTEPEPKPPVKVTISSGAQASPSMVSQYVQCSREVDLYKFLELKSKSALIPMEVAPNRSHPVDPRLRSEKYELSLYYTKRIVPNDIPVLTGFKVASLGKMADEELRKERILQENLKRIEEAHRRRRESNAGTVTRESSREEESATAAKNVQEIVNSSSSSICTATPRTVTSAPQSPDGFDEPPQRFLVSQGPRTPSEEPRALIVIGEPTSVGPRTPPPQISL